MSQAPAFSINLNELKSRRKDSSPAAMERAEQAGEERGFVPRDEQPERRGGRPPSPRTGQIHAKVLPTISDAVKAEAKRRGVEQGVLIEEMWALYLAQHAR